MATDNKDFKVKHGLTVGGDGTFSGTVTVATPTDLNHAVTKAYVDALAGGSSLIVSETPPTSPSQGDSWVDSTTGRFYVYYDSYWVELASGAGEAVTTIPGPTGPQGPAGIQGEIGFPGFKYDTRRVFANQYVVGEIIEYNGEYFVCLANNDAIPPTGGALGVYWAAYSFQGPQGIQGEPGIVTAVAPLQYDAQTQTISIDAEGLSEIEDNKILTIMGAL